MNCAVPDCENEATEHALISINNTVKAMMPLCAMHAEAAMEDREQEMNANKIDGYDRDNLGESPDY